MTKRVCGLALLLPVLFIGYRGADVAAAPASPAPKAHMNMLQLMRAFPFIHSNVLFDTQSRDPVGPEKKDTMVYSVYRWQDWIRMRAGRAWKTARWRSARWRRCC